MNSTITLMGSILISSLFLLNILGFYGDVVEHQNVRMQEMWTQESMASVAQIVEYDFNKLGSGLANASQAILSITDSTDITFLGDVDNDGSADLVRYYVSDSTAATSTENPKDIILYRVVNGVQKINTPAGVTGFKVKLLDWRGNYTMNIHAAASVELTLEVQSMFRYGDNAYPIAVWHKRITPVSIIRITGNKAG